VTAGIAEHRPRQAFFVRAGAQTIATYAAMALDCHGPALTLSGATVVATTAWQIARRFMAAGAAQEVILLGADRIGERLVAAAFLLSAGNGAEDPFARFREDRVAHESPSPVLCLYAAASALAKDMQ
jgi:3-oxoacyl-(acyl-carrier-protein) synthase